MAVQNTRTMKRGLPILLTLLLTLLPPVLPGVERGHAEDTLPGSRPLNLSLPHALQPAERMSPDSANRTDLAHQSPWSDLQDGRHKSSLPYGSGYEARQRLFSLDAPHSGNAAPNVPGWGRNPGGSGRGGPGR